MEHPVPPLQGEPRAAHDTQGTAYGVALGYRMAPLQGAQADQFKVTHYSRGRWLVRTVPGSYTPAVHKRLLIVLLLSISLFSFACGDDGDDSPPTGSNALEVEVAIEGPGILEIEFTTPAADGSFLGHDLFVETVSWSIGQTSVLRVAGTAVQESGTVAVDMVGPVARGTVRQSPWGRVTMYVDGTIYQVDPGQPFSLTR